jgi:hypothetical protein
LLAVPNAEPVPHERQRQAARVVRLYFFVGGAFVLCALSGLVTFASAGPVSRWFGLAAGVIGSLGVITLLSLAIILRRRRRGAT